MRYHIPLDENPSTNVALRNKYIAAFGSACYMSEFDTFDCFYQKWQDACADAAKIGEVSENAPFDKGYMCQPVAGTEDYTLQVGPDVANFITINYQAAPRQTPLVMVNGMPTEASGPYRNLVEMTAVASGKDFNDDSGMVDADGGALKQREWVLAVNRNANDGGIRSDLAGFTWICKDVAERARYDEGEHGDQRPRERSHLLLPLSRAHARRAAGLFAGGEPARTLSSLTDRDARGERVPILSSDVIS